ncbi:spore germination protein [Natroniella sulfidigena]|uniref:GerAB/ArcD/ProY family transporter n=1 Tax=Natroniella sulfidigena TaxID=723921 RepID=UPI00200B651B|nr:endospore germination permease [Natroniella sulfidigena]MCK8816708.1 spore germination protein [Natroniella sulfidigena]
MELSKIKREQISNRQLIFIIIHNAVGTGFLSLPRSLAEVAQRDSWLPVIISGILWSGGFFLIYKLAIKFPNDTLVGYSDKIVGPYLGKIISLSYILYATLVTGLIARISMTVLASVNLPDTPIPVTLSLFLFTGFYLVSQGTKALARLDEFLFFGLTPLFLVLAPMAFNVDWINFRPMFQSEPLEIIEATYLTMYSFLAVDIMFIIFPFVEEQKKALKSSLIGLFIVTLTYLFITVLVVGFYGIEAIQYITWPTLSILKALNVPFFGRLEFFFFFLWIAIAFTSFAPYFYISSYGLADLFNFKHQNYSSFILLPIIAFVAFFPKNLLEIFSFMELIATVGLALTFGIPLLFLTIIKLRGLD